MSALGNPGIPLVHAPDGTGYKLLELPPELLELLESQDPPTLTLHPSPTAALLKTPSKTYSLRQKNTSNSLILLEPTTTAATPTASSSSSDPGQLGKSSSSSSSSSSSAAAAAEATTTGPAPLRAIATLHETIELVPEADAADAAAGAGAGAAKPRGKWHEKFARGR